MKILTFVISTMALGAVLGITATHFTHVNALVKGDLPSTGIQRDGQQNMPSREAKELSKDRYILAMQNTQNEDLLKQNQLLKALAKQQQSIDSARRMQLASQDDKRVMDSVLDLLKQLSEDNKKMRQQISETNRDMYDLTLRVDSHSNEFRPLRFDSNKNNSDNPRRLENIIENEVYGDNPNGGVLGPYKE